MISQGLCVFPTFCCHCYSTDTCWSPSHHHNVACTYLIVNSGISREIHHFIYWILFTNDKIQRNQSYRSMQVFRNLGRFFLKISKLKQPCFFFFFSPTDREPWRLGTHYLWVKCCVVDSWFPTLLLMCLIQFVHFGKEAAILCEHDIRPPLFPKSQVKV